MVKRIINNKTLSTKGFEDLYPYELNFYKINGLKMNYIDKGKGRPVLMVHGNPTWSFYFRSLINGLSPDFRTIVPDHIGCGFSDKPDNRCYRYTLENRVRDLSCFINHLKLDEKIILIVHDWGGMISLAWALKNLDMIDKIIIMNSSGFLLPGTKKFPFRLALIKYFSPFAVPAVLGLNLFAFAALFLAPATSLSKKVKKGLTAPYNSWKNRIATLEFVKDIPLSLTDRSHGTAKFVDDNLHKINAIPTMFLWGLKDFVFDVNFLNEWKIRLPNAQYHVFENSGHYLLEDNPDESLMLIKDFLE